MDDRVRDLDDALLPYYRPQGNEVALFEYAFRHRLPVLIKGPTGCGKTRFVAHMAARLGRPLYTVACHDDLGAADLVGRHLIGDGATYWSDGPLTRAVREGGICYLDEIVEARRDTTVVIHPLADDRRVLPIERTGELLEAPPGFMLVMSFNPGYQNLLKSLKPSTRQRFMALRFDYPAPEIEREILEGESGIEPDLAQRLVALGNALRSLRDHDLEEPASTRLLVYAAMLMQGGFDAVEACRAALVEPLTDDRETAEPGLRARYARLVAAHLALRPDPARLPADEAVAERAVRAAIERPGSIIDLPPARRAPAPVSLWLHPVTARTSALSPSEEGDNAAASSGGAAERDCKRRPAEHVAMPDGRDGLIVFRLESLFSIGEYVPAKRATDEGDADAAHADDFDNLSLARDDAPVASRVRFDLDLPAAEQDDAPLGDGVLLPEWDYRKQALLSDHCRVQPLIAARAVPCRLPQQLRTSARRLRRQFEALAPARHWQSRRPDGAEPDVDAWLRYSAERARGLTVSTPDLYRDLSRGRRDLACLLLADLSLSTDSWVGERRVVDVIRDALFLFSEALNATGDRLALYGFSSRRREHVRFHHLKGFDEAYCDAVRGRIAVIKPGFYTRMGAAIRQSATILSGESAGQRLLLILTDGKPNDLDRYEGRYGIEDTRHAVLEAKRAGLLPFCVTVDEEGSDYLPYLFGAGNFVVLHRPDDLPRELPPLYARLTRAP